MRGLRGSPGLLGAPAPSLTLALVMALPGCGARPEMPDPVPDTMTQAMATMPEVRVEQVAGGDAIAPDTVRADVAVLREELALGAGERVTLTARDTDLRALLTALAEAAGVNLVASPDVEGRVTVHLQDVPAREALETVIRESGHMVAEPLTAPWGPVVFYVSPRNIDEMTVAEIRAHFGVSEEMARFIVRARIPR